MDFPKSKPYACMAASGRGREELLRVANRLSKGQSFVLVLRKGDGLAERLLPSFICAFVRYGEGEMRSDSLQKEIMLFVAGTMNIGSAIRSVGITEGGEFILFTSDASLCSVFLKEVSGKKVKELELILDKNIASGIAAAGIKEN